MSNFYFRFSTVILVIPSAPEEEMSRGHFLGATVKKLEANVFGKLWTAVEYKPSFFAVFHTMAHSRDLKWILQVGSTSRLTFVSCSYLKSEFYMLQVLKSHFSTSWYDLFSEIGNSISTLCRQIIFHRYFFEIFIPTYTVAIPEEI